MRRKILLFILTIMLTFTGLVNVSAMDEYEGELTIEYLLRNYNVVTLGTKDRYSYSAVNDKTGVNGSVTNVFDIGGPVLIRGNYSGTESFENEFAQKTNGIPSYIKGNLGQNVRAGSKELADISNIYVGNSNTVYKSENVYVVNKTKYNYEYPVYRTDDYIGFDNLYAAIVNEQKTIDEGKNLLVNDSTLVMQYKNYLESSKNKLIITEPGNYNYTASNVDKIYIFNYDPNELYVITNTTKYIYEMPEIEIRYSDGTIYKTDDDAIYCGRKNSNEDCTGNIIWNFKKARYVKANYTTIGHIVAPKADVELLESHYAGTIIANSVASEANKKTAIQFYPYNLDKELSKEQGKTCVTEIVDTDADVYEGNYSLDELLKNYSVVSLGQKEYSPNTKLSKYDIPNGSVNLFHIAGGFLINGNLGLEDVEYTSKNKFGYNGIKLDFRYSDSNYSSSFLKGNLGTEAHYITYYRYNNGYHYPYLSYSKLYMNSNTDYAANKDLARGAMNEDLKRETPSDERKYTSGYSYSVVTKYYYEYIYSAFTYIQDNETGNYLGLGRNIYSKSDNYINFKKLYDSIVEQQEAIYKDIKLEKTSNGELVIPVGGYYYIDNLEDINRIKFSNWSNNEDELTVITITDSGSIKLPKLVNEKGYNVYTSDYYGRGNSGSSKYYPNEYITTDEYHGNIVWNIPNANYIELTPYAPFFGHIIAPNADVEMPELHFAGTMIVNSLYAEGYTEAHFFPLKTGSVGIGVGTRTKVIGVCDIDTADITGTVKWNDEDNASGERPNSVTIKLLANGEEVDEVTISETDGWKYVFKNKPKTSKAGKKLNYTIKIDKVENYNSLVSGFNITNTYRPQVDALTLEYLLRNYNIVSLGTKDYYANSVFDGRDPVKGSVTNVYDIGGPVLIRGNLTNTSKLGSEFAEKTNGIPSFILGKLGDNVTPGSIEYVDISDIFVGTNNTVYKSDKVYQVNNTTFKYEYPVYRSDEYLGFDSLYATIVTEQSTLDNGKQLLVNDPTLLMKYNQYLNTSKNNMIITEPGNYNYSATNVNKIYIFDYDPNEVYIINNTNKYIPQMPEVEIIYSDGKKYSTADDAIYCGRTDENEDCTGNIIWSFKNARYVRADYSTIGHIVAPNADVELLESHYAGTIIANSVTSLSNSKTAVQFYPYNLSKKLITQKGSNCITEDEDLDDDVYSGNYSLDELLKNYSVVTLGQKDLDPNTKLFKYGAPTGTTNIFHIAGGFLINGDLGVEQVEYKEEVLVNRYDSSSAFQIGTNYTYPGIRLDFRFTNINSSNSYLKGKLGSHAYSNRVNIHYNTKFYVSDNFRYAKKNVAQNIFKLTSWTYKTTYSWLNDYDYNKYITDGNKYMLMYSDNHGKSNNYINFKRLYNSIVEQQNKISLGNKLSKQTNGDLVVPIGGNYYIDSLDDISRIRFSSWSRNSNNLTVITIKDSGVINFPVVTNEYGSYVYTSDYYGRSNDSSSQKYKNEYIASDQYHGNIVWNFPNATYIKLAPYAPFFGHIIAPNADVETPELHFAGAMIVNSLNSEGHSEAHFYPLRTGSVGTGVEIKKKVIGVCETETVDISGTITWKNDDISNRPKEMTISLLKDGKKIQDIVVTEEDGWKYEVKGLPKLNPSGKEIKYTITTGVLSEYSTLVSGYNIINTYENFDLSYSIEYLLRNYNVVTLGTKEIHGNINTNVPTGSVANVFDIGGPVLIRGNYVGNPKLDNEFAQKTNGVPSYIKGYLGKGITPGSIEYAEISDIYVGNSNTVHNNGSVYVVNENSFDFGYPAYTKNNYVDFDKLYASIVNEQNTLATENVLTNSSNTPYIYSPGTYILTASTLDKVSISNYDPEKLYILRIDSTVINKFPELEIRYSTWSKNDTDSDAVYCGRKNSDEVCGGNIIWSLPNARYIHAGYSTTGHIVAPKADIELVESHYPGSIIANTIVAPANGKTAIQYYPYNLEAKLPTVECNTCVTETTYSSSNPDIYEGRYSIDELLKNYSIVTLGQKELGKNTKLAQYGAPTGTTNIFHIVGGFLIEGDLGVKKVAYEKRTSDGLSGMKLEFRYYNSSYANSFLKGNLNSNAHTIPNYNWYNHYKGYNVYRHNNGYSSNINHLKYTKLYVTDKIRETDEVFEAQLAFNVSVFPDFTVSSESLTYYGDTSSYAKDIKTGYYLRYNENNIASSTSYVSGTSATKYVETDKNTIVTDNDYIDFKTLYDSIVYQQKNIAGGQIVTPNSSGIVTIPVGGNYTIQNIAKAKKIRFTNYSNNKNVLTVVSINDGGSINLPFEETDSYNNVYTNSYYNRRNEGSYVNGSLAREYSNERIENDTYYGNIVFNIPNAEYIKFASYNSFKGHVIAPNADIEMPEMNFAGAMIANSLNADGHSEAHFYPLTVGSVGTGSNLVTTETIGTCEEKETVTITGKKIWDDNNNQDGVRPEEITVKLLADGKKLKEFDLSESTNNWSYNVTLPKRNALGQIINYTVTENAVENYSTKIDGYDITNSYTPKKTSLTVNKVWDDENNNDGKRPESVMVQLYANDNPTTTLAELNEENNWTHIFNSIDMYNNGQKITYTVKEVIIPDGYTSTITGSEEDGYTITNVHKPEKRSIVVNKEWDDEDNRDGWRLNWVDIQLYKDGEALGYKVVLSDNNNWTHTYKDLYVYENGKKIEYTLEETHTSGLLYTSTIKKTEEGFTVINKHIPEKTSVSVEKVWFDKDNIDGPLPKSIDVQLYADGEPYGDVVKITEENDWKYTFEDLYLYNNRKKISYTVKEVGDLTDDYTSWISGTQESGYKIYNNSKKRIFVVNILWDDENNLYKMRPEKTLITLYANGEAIDVVELLKDEDWTYVFKNLDRFDSDGKTIRYTLGIGYSEGYNSVTIAPNSKGYTVTKGFYNKTFINVNKRWQDDNNRDGIRPESIMIQLYGNDKPVGTPVELNETNGWYHHFKDIPLADENGKITYTAKEILVPSGYSVYRLKTGTNSYSIINSYSPKKYYNFYIRKAFDDDWDRDGKRPQNIMFQLYADGEPYGDVVTLNRENGWYYKYNQLYVYNNGKKIDYTLKEVSDLGEYTPKIERYLDYIYGNNGFYVVNHYDVERTSLSVNKVWNDEDDQDGIRPESIDIQLYGNDKKIGDIITLNKENNWTYTFENLYANEKQTLYGPTEKIKYTIKEIEVDGYTSEIIENGTNGYTITNSHKPTKTTLTIDKIWKDENNKYGIRPNKIKVQLYKNGKPYKEPVEITKEDDWKYTFEDLDVYDNGEKVEYTIKGFKIDGYITEITGDPENGFTITNTHEENPLTLDNISKFVIVSIISSIILVIVLIIFNRVRRKEV